MGRADAPKRVSLNPADTRVVFGAFVFVSSGGSGAHMQLDGRTGWHGDTRPDHEETVSDRHALVSGTY